MAAFASASLSPNIRRRIAGLVKTFTAAKTGEYVDGIARIEEGAETYNFSSRLNGQPSAIIAVYQLPGSNAVQAAEGVKSLLAEQRQRLPSGVDYTITLDTTRAVTEGIKEIVETLVIAIVLVIAVVYLFLHGWRATLIPLLAVPVLSPCCRAVRNVRRAGRR